MVKVLIVFQLLIGVVFLVLAALLYLLVAGYTSGVASIWEVCLYWGGLFSGPLLMVIGSSLSALGRKSGPPLGLVGASLLTLSMVYQLVLYLKAQDRGDIPYMLHFLAVAVIIALAADASAYLVMKKGLTAI